MPWTWIVTTCYQLSFTYHLSFTHYACSLLQSFVIILHRRLKRTHRDSVAEPLLLNHCKLQSEENEENDEESFNSSKEDNNSV